MELERFYETRDDSLRRSTYSSTQFSVIFGMETKYLDIYQAAAFLSISPELLQYFTRKTVKSNDSRKLNFKKDGELYKFEEDELKDYDSWLRASWPNSPQSSRPHLPDAIKQEIRLEANLECALCLKSGEAGEAAHIEPVKTGKCNHPHNLIWLCANHHTKFDNGLFGPIGAKNEEVIAIKKGLQYFRRVSWSGQASVLQQIASALSICSDLNRLLDAQNEPSHPQLENIAKQVFVIIPELAKRSHVESLKPTLEKLVTEIKRHQCSSTSIDKHKIKNIALLEDAFLESSDLAHCPLCKIRGVSHSYDCPVCHGDGSIDKNLEIDVTEFDLVQCKLCKGSGHYHCDYCKACGGEGEMERRFERDFDYSQFDLVDCPLCKGSGRFDGECCRVCDGDRAIMRKYADNIDTSEYDYVDCPLCEGSGRHNGDTCLSCNGERQMLRKYADSVDVSQFSNVKCPACKGKRLLYGDDCIACNGEGYMPAGQADQLDTALYKMVRCPSCKGKSKTKHYECRDCNSEGELLKYYVDKYNF
ncbi:hypothetical protein PCH70_13840 [Pseudomonas cichorii JBC1]|nr:hypothetical protein PCH70_13840 [Pseudomonas cichorii JBC1]